MDSELLMLQIANCGRFSKDLKQCRYTIGAYYSLYNLCLVPLNKHWILLTVDNVTVYHPLFVAFNKFPVAEWLLTPAQPSPRLQLWTFKSGDLKLV